MLETGCVGYNSDILLEVLAAVWRKRADSNLSPFFRHGIVTVLPWETHAGEKAGESVLPRSEI